MRSIITNPLLLSIAGLLSTSAIAETVLQPVVVTASRYEQNLDDTLSSTTLITRKDIEESSASTLEDLLMSVSGLDVVQSGAYGKNSSIFMRGTNSNHVLTMINGVKTFSATTGGTAFQHIPLSQIERIEIVRGPRSGLYGSEAIGGVIQIFTRKGKIKPSANFNIEEGSNNTSKVDAGFSGRDGKFGYSLFASQFSTDGIDSISHTTQNDTDGYDKKSISTNLSYDFSKTVALDFNILDTQGTTLYDNCYNSIAMANSDNCYSDIEQQSVSTKIKLTPQGIWDASLQFGSSKDLNDNFWEDTPNNIYITEHYNINFQNNFQLSKNNLLVAGIDSTKDTVEATPYTVFDNTRDNQGVYASWKVKTGATTFKTSLRTDDNEQFGTHTTGTLSAGYQLANKIKAFASYGTAFKAPTFNELYFPFYGSPTLVPEESVSIEMGLRQKRDWGKWEVSLYNTTIDNLIAYDTNLFTANNISKAEIDGIEASVDMKISSWKIKLSSTFIDPINKDTTYYDNVLVKRAKYSNSIKASRQYGKTGIFISILNQGKRYTDNANTSALDAYTVVDLKLNYKVNKNITTAVKINNLFDEDYLLNGGFNIYNTLGRTLFVTMSYKM